MEDRPHQSLWIIQTKRIQHFKDLTDQLSQMAMTERRCRIQTCCWNRGKQAMGTNAPPEPKGITWGGLKTLDSRAEEVMKDVEAQDTPKN